MNVSTKLKVLMATLDHVKVSIYFLHFLLLRWCSATISLDFHYTWTHFLASLCSHKNSIFSTSFYVRLTFLRTLHSAIKLLEAPLITHRLRTITATIVSPSPAINPFVNRSNSHEAEQVHLGESTSKDHLFSGQSLFVNEYRCKECKAYANKRYWYQDFLN